MSELSLPQRLAQAMLELRGWEADKTNKEQRYDYISADAVLHRVGEALARNGVVVVPSIKEQAYDVGTTSKGNPRYDAFVVFEMRLVCDGGETITSQWIGRGTDYGAVDKAIYKAITSGHKYFLMKLLNIGVGNEDSEHETEAAAMRTSRGQQAASESIATKKAFLNEVVSSISRYHANPARAGNAINKVLNGRAFEDVPREQLMSELVAYATKRDAEETLAFVD